MTIRSVRVRDTCTSEEEEEEEESKEQVETWLILISIDRYLTITIVSEFMYFIK